MQNNILLKTIIVQFMLMSTTCLTYADESIVNADSGEKVKIDDKESRKEELKSLLIELLTEDINKKKSNKKEKTNKPNILVFQNTNNGTYKNYSSIKNSGNKIVSKQTNKNIENKKYILNDKIIYPFKAIIEKHAIGKNVDPMLVRAVIKQESNNNIKALSHKKAKGLMQLMDPTAKRFNVSDSYDPDENIRGGVTYLRLLMDEFKLEHALAAYNAGEGAVRRWGGIPPYKETQNYVKKVMFNYNSFKAEATPSIAIETTTKKVDDRSGVVSTDKQRLKSKLMVYSFDNEVER